jgi:diguanylate cyclase (GGDEF)-like protein
MFIFRTQRENKHLHALKNDLERSLIMDALTGLKNREAFRRLRRRRRVSCLILVNIDRFKHINEFYGSEVGDYVLKKIADRLREMIADKTDISVFRLGGDDFGFVYETGRTHCDDEALAAAYHRQLEDFFVETQGVRIDISFTIGISREKDRLFETADMALKYAKRSQRKRYAVYSSEIDQRENIQKNIQMIQKVRDALVHDSVLPYFQPIFDIKRNQTARYEALARIEQEHEQNKVLMPYHFLGAAREAKLSGEITREILRKTFVVAQDCPGNFSVNISAEDIEDQENRNEIFALLAHHRDIADKITFEILESEEIGDYEAMNEFIRSVKRFGCEIAIDDFGSGYSNFEKILKLDIDYIKIDGSLIKKIDYDRHTEWIVRTILEFARHAGFKSVAEFVHSKAVYDKVVELGFDYAQGYFIGKPAREVVTGQHHPVE